MLRSDGGLIGRGRITVDPPNSTKKVGATRGKYQLRETANSQPNTRNFRYGDASEDDNRYAAPV